jgi:hypothetical protein
MAEAQAEAAARAAALAQASAEAQVAVGVAAAAEASARAAAAAYAAAAAQATAQVQAFAAAQAFAYAQADAFAAAQACATAGAAAQACATAAAEAAVRAEVSAQACAEALTQAMAMANAAAEASASARTSVDVVPDIETSVRAVIDPDCITPVCEQAGRPVQCPPCNSCCGETPGMTTRQCPEPRDLTWDFGTLPAGMHYTATKSIPADVATHLLGFTIVGTYETYSDLPPDGSFSLDLASRTGTVSGTFAAGASYRVVLEFVDAQKCPIGTLTVLINTGRSPGQTETTQACMAISAVFEQQQAGFLTYLFGGGMTEIAVQVVVNSAETRTTAFQLCGALRQQFLLIAAKEASGPQKERLAFNRWEQKNPGSDKWTTASEEPSLNTYLVNGAAYRAVYQAIAVGTVTPGTTTPGTTTPGTTVPGTLTRQPCLNVSAVYVYEMLGSTAVYPPTMRTVEEPLSVLIVVNGNERRTTDFQVCGAAGARITLQASAEAYSANKDRLVFSYWERYNSSTGSWEAFSEVQMLLITLQQGGQIRAVYRQG